VTVLGRQDSRAGELPADPVDTGPAGLADGENPPTVRTIEAYFPVPPVSAPTKTMVLRLTVEVVTTNVPDFWFAGMVMLAGTDVGWMPAVPIAKRETTCPPAGAPPVRITVQVVEDPPISVAGLQATEEMPIAPLLPLLPLPLLPLLPLPLLPLVPVPLVPLVPVPLVPLVPVPLVPLLPLPLVPLVPVPLLPLLPLPLPTLPPEIEPPEIVPPVALTVKASPEGPTATAARVTGVLLAPPVMVKVIDATTPLGMAFVFVPLATHV
jgi:hypothetical protein